MRWKKMASGQRDMNQNPILNAIFSVDLEGCRSIPDK